jgi:hypothetical protein
MKAHHDSLFLPPSFFFWETWSPYKAQAGLELLTLLPQPAQCGNYRWAPPSQAMIPFPTLKVKREESSGGILSYRQHTRGHIHTLLVPLGSGAAHLPEHNINKHVTEK